MKANELRIGNFVDFNGPFLMDYHAIHDTYINNDWDDLSPIPLTEEWLIKFGFEVREGNCYYKYWILGVFKTGFELTKYQDGSMYFAYSPRRIWTDEAIESFPLLEIKYVHQLQNLYFSLTGEELEIKKAA